MVTIVSRTARVELLKDRSLAYLFSAIPTLEAQQQVGEVQLQRQAGRAVAHSLVVVVQGSAVLVDGDQGIADLCCQVAVLGLLLQCCFQSLWVQSHHTLHAALRQKQ